MQDAAHQTYTDLAIDVVSTDWITSAADNFASDDVGNVINITAGTGFTTGRYVITSVTGGIAVLDRACGTAASTGGSGTLGGAMLTPSIVATLIVHGAKVWLNGTFTISSTTSGVANGKLLNTVDIGNYNNMTVWEGYGTTRGDNVHAVLNCATATGYTVVQSTGRCCTFRNITVDGNSLSTIRGFHAQAYKTYCWNCKAIDCTNKGFEWRGLRSALYYCLAENCSSRGFVVNVAWHCMGKDNNGHDFELFDEGYLFNCVSEDTAWIAFLTSNAVGGRMSGCVAYSPGQHGFYLSSAFLQCDFINCIAYGCGLYGFGGDTVTYKKSGTLTNCAGGSNTSGNVDSSAFAADENRGFITLTGDPFMDSSNSDFRLNNVAGAGRACIGAGYPEIALWNDIEQAIDVGASWPRPPQRGYAFA